MSMVVRLSLFLDTTEIELDLVCTVYEGAGGGSSINGTRSETDVIIRDWKTCKNEDENEDSKYE